MSLFEESNRRRHAGTYEDVSRILQDAGIKLKSPHAVAKQAVYRILKWDPRARAEIEAELAEEFGKENVTEQLIRNRTLGYYFKNWREEAISTMIISAIEEWLNDPHNRKLARQEWYAENGHSKKPTQPQLREIAGRHIMSSGYADVFQKVRINYGFGRGEKNRALNDLVGDLREKVRAIEQMVDKIFDRVGIRRVSVEYGEDVMHYVVDLFAIARSMRPSDKFGSNVFVRVMYLNKIVTMVLPRAMADFAAMKFVEAANGETKDGAKLANDVSEEVRSMGFEALLGPRPIVETENIVKSHLKWLIDKMEEKAADLDPDEEVEVEGLTDEEIEQVKARATQVASQVERAVSKRVSKYAEMPDNLEAMLETIAASDKDKFARAFVAAITKEDVLELAADHGYTARETDELETFLQNLKNNPGVTVSRAVVD